MKILLVNKFHYLRGGAERVYFNTKRLLESAGHQVICFSMKDPRNLPSEQEHYFVDNIDFENNGDKFKKAAHYFYSAQAREKMEMLLDDEKPDIVHLHNFAHHLTNSILTPIKKRHIPVVQTLHDYQWICPNYQLFVAGSVCERCKKHKYFKAVFHKCLKNSFGKSLLGAMDSYWQWLTQDYKKIDLFLSPSFFLKEKFEQFGFQAKVDVLPNFIELENYAPSYESQPYIVFAGRLSPEKGLLQLLSVIKDLAHIKLKVLGAGPQQGEVSRFLSQNNLENVEILGTKNGPEYKNIIANCRFVVMPSVWHENFPMTALESMALGKPVLAARLGGLPEIISENFNGWLYDADKLDDLKTLIENNFSQPEVLSTLGKNARKTVEEKFSAQIHLKKLLEIYQSLSDKIKVSLG